MKPLAGSKGKAYGLEADAWGDKRIRQGLAEALRSYLAGQPLLASAGLMGRDSGRAEAREAYWARLVG